MNGSSPDPYYVYILRCSDGTLYTGIAADLGTRIRLHNEGRGAKYTRSRLPAMLLYFETAAGRGDALRREAQIKRLSRKEKLCLAGEEVDDSAVNIK